MNPSASTIGEQKAKIGRVALIKLASLISISKNPTTHVRIFEDKRCSYLLKGHCQSRACASYEIPNLNLSAGIIQDPSDKFKMGSTSGGSGHGGKRTNAGRKRIFSSPRRAKKEWEKKHKRIYVEEKIFKAWINAKFEAGYQNYTDSVFVEHLLSLEYRRR